MNYPHHATAATVTFREVTVASDGVHILDAVSATVPPGGCTAIIGPNGAGKTTLLLTLLGQISYAGEIRIDCGQKSCPPRLGYVPQRFAFDREMPISVTEFLLMGNQRLPFWFGCRKKYRTRAEELLVEVGAERLSARRLGALSGGELQRVLLALALAQSPNLLVLDEPTAGVDTKGEHLFCELLDTLRRTHGFTQLMVSHDLATVTHHATHVICLNRRVVADGPPLKVLTAANLTALFGLHMGLVDSRAMPDGEASCTAPCCQEEPSD